MNSFASAIKGIKRNFPMASASMILVTLTLVVFGAVIAIGINTYTLSKNVVDDITIYAYVENGSTPEQIAAMQTQIEAVAGVDAVQYSSPDEELDNILKSFDEETAKALDETYSQDNPLYGTFKISVAKETQDLNPIITEVKEIEGIRQVNELSTSSLTKMVDFIKVLQLFGVVLASMLLLVSIFIITNTIRLAITARRKEVEIMRLVGATKMYIRAPFIIEGIIIGIVGGLFASGLVSLVYWQTYRADFFRIIQAQIYKPELVVGILLVTLIAFGMIIGSIGSVFALRKHLKT